MTKHAAAYLRRSSVSGDSPGDASREAQQEATRRLQQAFAPDAELIEYVNWGMSGRKDDRPDYVRLKAAIERDEVCCVFAYSLSRLGRSGGELNEFFELCKAHLTGQRERLGYAVVDGLLPREQARDKAAEIDAELALITDDLAAPDTGGRELLTDASGEQYDPRRPWIGRMISTRCSGARIPWWS